MRMRNLSRSWTNNSLESNNTTYRWNFSFPFSKKKWNSSRLGTMSWTQWSNNHLVVGNFVVDRHRYLNSTDLRPTEKSFYKDTLVQSHFQQPLEKQLTLQLQEIGRYTKEKGHLIIICAPAERQASRTKDSSWHRRCPERFRQPHHACRARLQCTALF